MTRHPLFGLGLAILGALVLTPDTLLMRWADMDGFQMLAWRGLLSGFVFLSLWAITRRGHLITDISNLKSPFGAGLILCQFFNATLFSLGISIAPVSLVLFGIATVPVFSALFAFLILREATGLATWVTIIAVLAGIALALFSDESGQYEIEFWSFLGALAGLGVALCLALSFVLIRHKRNSPFVLAIGIGGLLSGTTGFLVTGVENMTAGNIEYIIITGAMILPFSFFLLSFAARHTHASNVSLALLLETVLGPVWVWFGTPEQPTEMMFIGGFIVVASLITYLIYTKRQM